MTRRPRRASSAPQRVGSDEGLTSAHPVPSADAAPATAAEAGASSSSPGDDADDDAGDEGDAPHPSSPSTSPVEQTKDDTDQGWGERGEDDASARWLRENRPPHWA